MNAIPLRRPASEAAPPVLSAAQARAAAEALVPRLAERAAAAEAQRRVPRESIDELLDCGLMRMLQPRRFGGSELGLDVFLDVVMTLCRGCASTAWVYSNLASHAWNIGQFELQAQEEVWGPDPRALAATGLAFPCGRATPAPGGYRLTGRWPFASGVDASTWMLVGGMAEQPGGAPERRFFLVPQADFRSLDNWHAYGLGATGSHDVEIKDAFVPAHRSVSAEVFAAGQNLPGARVHDTTLFRIPNFAAFAYILSIVPLGTAKAAVETFIAGMRQRAGTYTGVRVAELGPVQARIAEAASCVEFAETVLRRDWRELEDGVAAGQYPGMETKLRWKRNVAFATQLAVRAIDALMPAAGAGGLTLNLPLQRQFRDIHAASAHIALTWDVHAAAYGQSALGLQPQGGLLL
ncbi:MAG: acyl-CoA dehydrogenase family protein [Burkholderiales bacterium]|nr:acyl-CoA dehydrogenase family protein [Burkholderiales bacterium]